MKTTETVSQYKHVVTIGQYSVWENPQEEFWGRNTSYYGTISRTDKLCKYIVVDSCDTRPCTKETVKFTSDDYYSCLEKATKLNNETYTPVYCIGTTHRVEMEGKVHEIDSLLNYEGKLINIDTTGHIVNTKSRQSPVIFNTFSEAEKSLDLDKDISTIFCAALVGSILTIRSFS